MQRGTGEWRGVRGNFSVAGAKIKHQYCSLRSLCNHVWHLVEACRLPGSAAPGGVCHWHCHDACLSPAMSWKTSIHTFRACHMWLQFLCFSFIAQGADVHIGRTGLEDSDNCCDANSITWIRNCRYQDLAAKEAIVPYCESSRLVI